MKILPIADKWFEIIPISEGITLLREPHVHPLLRCNIWHVSGGSRDLLIDTGLGIASLRDAARHLFQRPLTVVATHFHSDHVGGLAEFANERCLIHAQEAELLRTAADGMALTTEQLGDDLVALFSSAGYSFKDRYLLSAVPRGGFRPEAHALIPVAPTGVLQGGDILDLENRSFEVLHLPGHTEGSIGLWESRTGTLFSGDAVYDGPLLDMLPESDKAAYMATMEKLAALPVKQVYGGHDDPFGGERLRELAHRYIARVQSDG